MQLQSFCLPVAMFSMVTDKNALCEGGVFYGWDWLTCLVVLLNALGGFAVSLTMKYADNILKTFAVSMSLVCNCLLFSIFFSAKRTIQDLVGVVLVIGATLLYSKAGT